MLLEIVNQEGELVALLEIGEDVDLPVGLYDIRLPTEAPSTLDVPPLGPLFDPAPSGHVLVGIFGM